MNGSPAAHRNQSGFTLLELSLAVAVGSVILLAALSVFGTMQSVSTRYQKRADDVHELERAHLILRRAFGSVVMATMSETRETFGQEMMERPRILLDNSGVLGAWGVMRLPEQIQQRHFDNVVAKSFRSTGSNQQKLTFEHPLGTGLPRLELALSRHPALPDSLRSNVPTTMLQERAARLAMPYGYADNTQRYQLPEGVGGLNALTDEEGSPVAVRGVFELVANPVPEKPRLAGIDPEPQTWSLYYRPIAIYRRPIEENEQSEPVRGEETGSESGEQIEQTEQAIGTKPTEELVEYRVLGLEESVQILSNVTFLRWIAFQGGHMRNAYRASAVTEMPAYMELEFTTASGLTAQWMFDVSWSVGAELGSELAGQMREEEQQRSQGANEEQSGRGSGTGDGGSGGARNFGGNGRSGGDR
ncbi:MAG: prepilin-type N-terminal cleavage/methylation domain-containing protein [Phycisphaeraceae bacterium]|nr:prepilin-type N-terminal cleavage/methylation domain-containing protein [Phycisphaerales bacterium]MCB9859936.1 prepilin-type N-terminal cleavage/methylation domain-containing protein [Phycisphaeraceae bacterium]